MHEKLTMRTLMQVDCTSKNKRALDTVNRDSPWSRWMRAHFGEALTIIDTGNHVDVYRDKAGVLMVSVWVADDDLPRCPHCPQCIQQHQVRVPLRYAPPLPEGVGWTHRDFADLTLPALPEPACTT